jgi:HSP20 family protein
MANIIKKDGGSEPTRTQSSGSMLQMLGDLLSFDPFRFLRTHGVQSMAWNPSFEVLENDDGYVFKADLPGVKDSDVDISLDGKRLEISGKREVEHEEGDEKSRYHTYERSYGSFSRAFALPDNADVDHITSDLKAGVLTLVVPKKAGAAQEKRKILIGQGSAGKA